MIQNGLSNVMLYPVMFFLKKKASEGKLSSKTIETGFRWEGDKDLLGKVVYPNGKEDLEETR